MTTHDTKDTPMADASPYPDFSRGAGDDTGPAPGAESTDGAPRWVKVFGIVALVLVLLVAIVLLTGGGNHGPGRHSSGGAGGQSAPAGAAESSDAGGHKPPVGGHTP